ncbi:hypothetical protein FBU59_005505 [Linderina macrospora]|uniref:Uncharacterized protein n=1 Tax=Linderina macrospora TaxID=4868 RepID=A0ACC1J2L4_9FUNG|nr:hypothetical protein FBU59_005505 [Linderina macrospora]
MDMTTANTEQLAYIATRTFSKLWMFRGAKESLQTFHSFCSELLRSTQIAVPIVVLTLLYVHKFKQRYPVLICGPGSEYRVFVVALMLASKYLEDNTFTTQTWSEVSNLPAKELTIMQREFLVALEHRLHVPENEYNAWITQLQTIVFAAPNMTQYRMVISPPVQHKPLVIPAVSTPSYPSANGLYSPVGDMQVVPSPTSVCSAGSAALIHEMPCQLPSPPAKRMRMSVPAAAASGYRVAVSAPRSVAVPPAVSSVCVMPQGDFTFSVPAQMAGQTVLASQSMLFSQGAQSHTVAHNGQPIRIGNVGLESKTFVNNGFMQQQQQTIHAQHAAAAAAAFAVQYSNPMYYGMAGFAYGMAPATAAAPAAFPIYN